MQPSQSNLCYCGSQLSLADCCQPLLNGEKTASSAEALMRSRFSAYASGNFPYILATYGPEQRIAHSLEELAKDSQHTRWLKLDVHQSSQNGCNGQVEFSAYYQFDGQFYRMHESSQFVYQDGQWYYTTGKVHKDSGAYQLQRNDHCLCGSGKKFKKCCGSK